VFRSALEKIHQELAVPLNNFQQGDVAALEPARPYLESCLLGRRIPDRRNNFMVWGIPAVAVALLVGLVFWNIRNQRRWDAYIDALRRQPGIVVTRAERSGSGGHVEGLRDPLAPDPAAQMDGFQLDPERVGFTWQPFLSLNTPFATEREVQADVDYIHRQIVRFDVGSYKLTLAELGQLDELGAAIKRLLKARQESHILILGRTDEIGTPEDNATLSLNRATSVRQALAVQGIPLDSMAIKGVGNTDPLRTGASEWDRAANRSVSVRIELAGRP
jgi:outer membrane protein OmpA-like peptidoglycan-associated protein